MKNKSITNLSFRKLLLSALVAGPLVTLPVPLWALPSTLPGNVSVTSGAATFAPVVGNTLGITATAEKTVLTWVAFGDGGANAIASTDRINYTLPTPVTSSILNVVSGAATTTVDGYIWSNGKVYILNPNGIVINGTATIDTAGFVASTSNENVGTFATTGALVAEDTTLPATAVNTVVVNGAFTTANNADGSGMIKLIGSAVDVGGTVAGNLWVRSLGGAVRLGQTAALSTNKTGAVGGDLTVRVENAAGAVTIGSANPVTVNGNLLVSTTGGTVTTVGAANADVNVRGTTGISTVLGSAAGGAVTLGTAAPTAAGSVFSGATTIGSGTAAVIIGNNASAKNTFSSDLTINTSNTTATAVILSNNATAPTAIGGNLSITGTGTAGGVVLNNAAAATTVTGTTGVTTKGGAVTLAAGAGNSTFTGDLTVTTVGGAVTLTGSTGNATALGNATINTSKTGAGSNGGAVAQSNNAGLFSVAGVGKTLTINTGGVASNGTVKLGGVAGQAAALFDAGTVSVTTGGATTILKTAAGDLALGNFNLGTAALSVGSQASITAAAGTTVTTTGGITLNADLAAAGSKSITLNGSGALNLAALTFGAAGGSVTVATSGTASNVALPTGITNVQNLSVTTTGGTITQAAGGIALAAGGTATFDASGAITLTDPLNDFATVVLKNGGAIGVVDANNITIGTGTSAVGNVTVATAVGGGGSIILGNAPLDSLTFGGTLTLNADGAGTISAVANNITVGGLLTLTTGGGNATINTTGNTFARINAGIGAGALTIKENAALDIGTITAASLVATSETGAITNSGVMTISGTSSFTAGPVGARTNITLTQSNVLAGAVTFVGNNVSLKNATTNLGASTIPGTLSVEDTVGDISESGPVIVSGVATFKTLVGNDVLLGTQANDFGTVSITQARDVNIQDANDVTITGTIARNTAVVSNGGNIVIGALNNVGTFDATTTTATGMTITDAADNISIGQAVTLNTKGGLITIDNSGSSFGTVNMDTTNGAAAGANIVYTEAATAHVGVVSTGTAGNLSVTSTAGGILENSPTAITVGGTSTFNAATSIILSGAATHTFTGAANWTALSGAINTTGSTAVNFGGAATLTATGAGNDILIPAGAITGAATLNSPRDIIATAAIGGAASLTAGRDVTLSSPVTGSVTLNVTRNVSLANAAVNLKFGTSLVVGTLTATTTTGTITQPVATDTLRTGGNVSLTTTGAAAAITLANSGNNFGQLTLNATGGANISIKEDATSNFNAVTTAGNFTSVSNFADIQDVSAAAPGIRVGGLTSLQAANINLRSTTATYTTVLLKATGNASLVNSAANNTVLSGGPSGTNVTGTLSLTGAAGQQILQAGGAVTVGGVATFDAGTTVGTVLGGAGGILLADSNNVFGGLKFYAGTGGVTISQNSTNDVVLISGSRVGASPVLITSLRNISTSGVGGTTSFFGGAVTLKSDNGGTIIVSNPMNITGLLTVNSAGTKNISFLSLSTNLNNVPPSNLGTGAYTGPSN